MKQGFAENVAVAAPSFPSGFTAGNPTDGDALGGTAPTTPGAWWFHMIGQSLERVITEAGLTPDFEDLDLLKNAIVSMAAAPEIVKQTTAVQDYVKYTQYTFAHALGVAPGVLQLKARCKTAEGGFSVGDVVFLPVSNDEDSSGGVDSGYVVTADASNIYLSLDTNTSMRTKEKNSISRFSWTDSYWEFFFFALA